MWYLWRWHVPDVSPQDKREQRYAHSEVADVGEGVETDEPKHSTQHVEEQSDREEHGGGPGRFEYVLAFVVRFELLELILQVLEYIGNGHIYIYILSCEAFKNIELTNITEKLADSEQ